MAERVSHKPWGRLDYAVKQSLRMHDREKEL